MIAGRTLFAFAASEVQSRHDLFDVITRMERTRDEIIITGEKCLVACGDSADHLLVLAREHGSPREHAGLSLVLVPRGTPGLRIRGYQTYDGRRCADITFDMVRVPHSAAVGAAGAAWPLVEAAMDRLSIALAAEAAGAMQKMLDLTLEYSRTRKQFGRSISANQAYQHRLVDMYVSVEEARSLAMHACSMLPEDRATRGRWASAAKAFASAAGRNVGEEGVQLHGAIGMTEDYTAGGLYKRLAAIANQHGDAQWHHGRIRDLADEQASGSEGDENF